LQSIIGMTYLCRQDTNRFVFRWARAAGAIEKIADQKIMLPGEALLKGAVMWSRQ
jgi:hypothetical protein